MEVAPYPNVADALLPRHVRAALRRARAAAARPHAAVPGVADDRRRARRPDARRGRRGHGLRPVRDGDRGQRRRRRDHARLPRLRSAAARDGARVVRRDRLAPRARPGGCSAAASRCARSPTRSSSSRSRPGPTRPAAGSTTCGRPPSGAIALAAWQRTAARRAVRTSAGRWASLPLAGRRSRSPRCCYAGAHAGGAAHASCSPRAALFAGIARAGADAAPRTSRCCATRATRR